MQTRDREAFESALKILAEVLQVKPPTPAALDEYWRILAGFDQEQLIKACRNLMEQTKAGKFARFPLPTDFIEQMGRWEPRREPWKCVCCHVKFPAGGDSPCECDTRNCFHCWKCYMHCQCEDPLELEDFQPWIDLKRYLGAPRRFPQVIVQFNPGESNVQEERPGRVEVEGEVREPDNSPF